MDRYSPILVTGSDGFVGSNLTHYLEAQGFRNVFGLTSSGCDLTDRRTTHLCFKESKPFYVFHLAAHVRGIMGNLRGQSEGFLRNVLINTHVIEACQIHRVKKIVAMGTVAMYADEPHDPNRGFCEGEIFDGPPHESEYGYAHAKRAMFAQLVTSGIPFAVPVSTNLYGPHDRFDIETGHCVPSLVRKAFEARRDGTPLTVWGDGSARRDFLYIKDVVRALHTIMDNGTGPINMATGVTHSVKEAATILADCAKVPLVFDTTKPTGQVTRNYDISSLRGLGFKAEYLLEEGLRETYRWYAENEAVARKR